MTHSRTSFRKIITRGLALMAMLFIYAFGLIGTSAVLLGASSTPAKARGFGGGFRGGGFGGGFRGGGFGGGFRGGGFRGGGWGRGGGFRGAGLGFGVGLGLGLASPYYYGGYPYGYGYGGYPYYAGGYGCYVVRRWVWTPYGYQLRRVRAC